MNSTSLRMASSTITAQEIWKQKWSVDRAAGYVITKLHSPHSSPALLAHSIICTPYRTTHHPLYLVHQYNRYRMFINNTNRYEEPFSFTEKEAEGLKGKPKAIILPGNGVDDVKDCMWYPVSDPLPRYQLFAHFYPPLPLHFASISLHRSGFKSSLNPSACHASSLISQIPWSPMRSCGKVSLQNVLELTSTLYLFILFSFLICHIIFLWFLMDNLTT